jgi:hypothetical protein
MDSGSKRPDDPFRVVAPGALLAFGHTLLVVEGGVNIRIAPEVSFKLLSKLEILFSVTIGIAWKGRIGNSLVSEPEKVKTNQVVRDFVYGHRHR